MSFPLVKAWITLLKIAWLALGSGPIHVRFDKLPNFNHSGRKLRPKRLHVELDKFKFISKRLLGDLLFDRMDANSVEKQTFSLFQKTNFLFVHSLSKIETNFASYPSLLCLSSNYSSRSSFRSAYSQ